MTQASDKSTTKSSDRHAPASFDEINANCEVEDLSTGIDILVDRLDDVCRDIMNEENAFNSWQEAHWIALRLKNDVRRIMKKLTDESNERYEQQRAPNGLAQAAE